MTCDEGGDRLVEIMRKFSLRCCSTYFQPPKKHSNATFMNVQPGKPPSQIDYIFVSQRWASSARCCSTKWGLPIAAYGRKYDHALVLMKFKLRLKCDNSDKRKDFKALNNPEVSELHEAKLTEALAQSNQPASVQEQWERLTSSLTAAQEAIPSSERKSHRKWETSEHTLLLIRKEKKSGPL